jgi:hypothetical protein
MPRSEQPKPDTPWKDSLAKRKLTKDILGGKVPPDWKPKRVLETRPELYKPYAKNFANNLRNLRLTLKAHQDRADQDDAAIRHDLVLFPRSVVDARGYPRWDGSAAQQFLIQDIKEGQYVGIKAKAFRETRPEYMQYPLKVFTDHIHQEKRALLEKSYWLNRKKKKAHEEDDDDSSM